MFMYDAVLTALITMTIVFAALLALYASIKVFSAIVRRFTNTNDAREGAQR